MRNSNARLRGERQLEVLAARPSNWRIFNVGRHLNRLRSTASDDSVRLFSSRRLDASIVVKHALRPNERDLFDRPPVVATKVLLPVDPQQMALGAYSFFVGERTAPQTMQRLLGIPLHGRGGPHPDVEILHLMDRAPSLDVFLLKEVLTSARAGIPAQIFDLPLAELPDLRSYMQRELAPLVAMAAGSSEPAKVRRVVDSLFGPSIGPQAEDFLTALGVPETQWAEVVFAWKAALYYERNAAEMRARFVSLASALRRLQTYGHSEVYPRSLVMSQLRSLASIAGDGYVRCQSDLALFNSARRARIIAGRDVGALGSYLLELPAAVFDYAGNAALVDHILSYWSYATSGLSVERMPAEIFSTLAANLCATASQYAGESAHYV